MPYILLALWLASIALAVRALLRDDMFQLGWISVLNIVVGVAAGNAVMGGN